MDESTAEAGVLRGDTAAGGVLGSRKPVCDGHIYPSHTDFYSSPRLSLGCERRTPPPGAVAHGFAVQGAEGAKPICDGYDGREAGTTGQAHPLMLTAEEPDPPKDPRTEAKRD